MCRARGLVLLLAVTCLSGCTAGGGQGSKRTVATPASPTPVPAVKLAAQRPIAVWQLTGSPTGFTGGHRIVGASSVTFGKDISNARSEMQQVAVVFPRPRVAARCIDRADLVLRPTRVQGSQAEVAVYPSDEASYLASAQRANAQLDLSRLIDNEPKGYVSSVGNKTTVVDVTALYVTWARGGPFPSQGRRVPSDFPFGVILRPKTAEDGRWNITIANSPTLEIYRRDECAA